MIKVVGDQAQAVENYSISNLADAIHMRMDVFEKELKSMEDGNQVDAVVNLPDLPVIQ